VKLRVARFLANLWQGSAPVPGDQVGDEDGHVPGNVGNEQAAPPGS
jgi:hypothetical protein